jgi:conjugative relaxase-like TrwC/TraI family protein
VLSSAKIGRSSWRYYSRTVAGGACEYYAEHGDAPGRWHGAGLGQLGLTAGARVEERELEALFGRALSPTTAEALGSAWRADAVTGFDLTFSAPKSVSTLWALGDARTMAAIDAAHGAAVTAALDCLEAHASLSRRGRDGVEQIGSAGFSVALFDHRTSRTGDPQLHTHALVVNKVRCDDGAWRTLDGHEIYHHKKAAGVVYQAALRAELTGRLPVVFGAVSEHGQAEIQGVPEALMAVWSSRTSAVMADAVPTIADAETTLGRPVSARERARIIKTAVLTRTHPFPRETVARGGRRRQPGWGSRRTR